MEEKSKIGRKRLDKSKKKKLFALYLSPDEVKKAGGVEKVKSKAYAAILGK